jgi:hypothetical protein
MNKLLLQPTDPALAQDDGFGEGGIVPTEAVQMGRREVAEATDLGAREHKRRLGR